MEADYVDGFWAGAPDGNPAESVYLYLDRRSSGYSGSAIFYSNDFKRQSQLELALLPLTTDSIATGTAKHSVSLAGFFFESLGLRQEAPDPNGLVHPAYGRLLKCDIQFDIHIEYTKPRPIKLKLLYKGQLLISATMNRDLHSRTVTALARTPLTWEDFKTQSKAWASEGKVFRGQSQPWAVRTKMHRVRRFDPVRFCNEDIMRLVDVFSAHLGRRLDPAVANDLNTLVGLAQHHRYPTPLLDWTRSPDVAGYFACNEICDSWPKAIEPTIFMFNLELYHRTAPQTYGPADLIPGIHIVAPLAEFNERLRNQEALATSCNLDPWEMHMDNQRDAYKSEFAQAFTITSDSREVLRDLRSRGVTATKLFPGLDGECRDRFEQSVLVA
jgi:FRG domain